ncbi:phage integrase SAM-like domain-containing protein [Bernardetia sp. Wsw4-3y2]|uniref:site-specific integrase n=1 Tax=Bernardetia sp. Wsw4-3y2 TaxID=3127471 RepID=UPI0030D508BC
MIYKKFNQLYISLFSQKLKNGKLSIRFRISINGQRENIATGIVLESAKQWVNPVIRSHKFAKQYNDRLTQIQTDLMECFNRLCNTGANPTALLVKTTYKGNSKPPITVLEVFENLLKERQIEADLGDIQHRTVESYKTIYKDLEKFLELESSKHLPANQFDKGLGKKFFLYLRTNGNGEPHARKKVTKVQTAFENALDDEFLDRNKLKNLGIKTKKPQRNINFLYPDEISRIEKKKMPMQRLEDEKTVFLFQCAVGLSDIDLRIFAKNPKAYFVKKNGQTWICTRRRKNGNLVEVPFFTKARTILEKCNYQLPIKALGNRNSYLKEIGTLARIDRIALTSHVARRSFATVLLNFDNVPFDTVSKLLGHSSIVTTLRHYAAVLPEKILDDVKHLVD